MRRLKTPITDVVSNVYGTVDQFKCYAGCGAIMNINTRKILHRGHIIAHYAGGDDSVENLRPECESCNLTHGTQNMFEYMKKYNLRPPIADPAFESYQCRMAVPRVFESREIRTECRENARVYWETHGKLRGIISAPTGAGKTLMTLEAIGDVMRANGRGVVLWITERKDILGTQFTPYNIFSWKEAGVIPREVSILFRSHLKYCDQFPDYCIIASTIDTAMGKDAADTKYFNKLMTVPGFLGIVVDETHMAGGDKTYEMITSLIPHSKLVLGLSATHKFDERMNKMYGDHVFLEYNYMQAIRDGVIRQVDFKISRAKRIAVDIPDACLFDRIDEMDRLKIYNQLIFICNSTYHHKGIIWCGSIRAAEKWHKYFSSIQTGIRVVGEGSHRSESAPIFLLDHSCLSPQRSRQAFEQFCNNVNVIMISARKHSQGVDVPNLDFGAIIEDGGGSRDVRAFLQMVGRLTRKSADCADNAVFCEFIVTADEAEYTKTMKSLIDEYYHGICERFSGVGKVPMPSAFDVQRVGGSHLATIRHVDGPGIQFEILDGLSDIDIFSRDEEFIANLLCRTGRCGIDYAGIKAFLKINGITEPAEAEMLFRELYDSGGTSDGVFTVTYSGKRVLIDEKTSRALIDWWGIVRYMGINYNLLLDIDSGKYYKTLSEARKAINKLIINVAGYRTMYTMVLYNVMRELDPRLPPDPLSTYQQKTIKNIIPAWLDE